MTDSLSFAEDRVGSTTPRTGLAPLVDIVLLLICFYLLVARSIQSRTEQPIDLPGVAAEHTNDPGAAEFVINLLDDGTYQLNGLPIGLETLRSALLTERARSAEMRPRVVVRADASRDYEALDLVLEACRDAGFGAVALRTRPEVDR